VADQHVAATDFPQHARGYFARVGAGGVLAQGLSPERDARSLQPFRSLREIRKRHAHRAFDPGRDEGIEQRRVRRQAAVHFPVAGNEPSAHPVTVR
jgi:hypothetical protein